MRILVAFDKFKDALTAPAACVAAVQALGPAVTVDACPLADGGEGFAEILTAAAGGELVPGRATGPRGESLTAEYGLVRARNIPVAARERAGFPAGDEIVAVIELAQASGLAQVPPAQRDPWRTTTLGTGELIRDAAARGAAAILLGVGGSATHDLGLGALSALGLRLESADGAVIHPPVPARWPEVAALAGSLMPLPPIRIACDVTNPLLGSDGAAAIYAPQKGLQPEDFPRLEYMTGRLAVQLCTWAGRPASLCQMPGAGAAGGVAFGLMAAAGAQLLPGATLVGEWLGLEARLATAEVIITGEGRFDDSSLSGKGPGTVVRRALDLGKQVHVFAGQVSVTAPPPGLHLHAITPPGVPLAEALAATERNLAAAVRQVFVSG